MIRAFEMFLYSRHSGGHSKLDSLPTLSLGGNRNMKIWPNSYRLMSLVVGCVLFAQASASERPNILFILADDVGREALECYGGTSYATPNLNQLAANGAIFDHCYAMPVCHPTRVTLLTGQYPRHLGNPKWGSFPKKVESRTFASIAKGAGYATAVAGKWQLSLMGKDLNQPQRMGFDQWSLFGWHEGPRYHDPMIYENGRLRSDTTGKYGPDLYVDFLLDFMKQSKNDKKRFMAFYSMALCHDVTDDLKKPVPHGPRGRYDNFAEMVEQMDSHVGQLMTFLKSSGLEDNTLVIFTADNGTAVRSKLSAIGNRNNFVYENPVSEFQGKSVPGGKGKLTDWGTRVPGIAVWKGIIKPGQSWDNLIDFSDFLPTFTDLIGGQLPADTQLDGHSFASLLRGQDRSKRQWAYAEHRGRFFVKTRDRKLYSTGEFFNTSVDPFEKSPLDKSSLSLEAKSDWRRLKQAVAELK
ncbi:sulfatase-like hydrolase/transferase [bacterium]|nr:sulfatase-like hydrolase/transferase [bacterium]